MPWVGSIFSAMRIIRLFKLLPTAFGIMGAAMIPVAGPEEAERNFCIWVNSVFEVPDTCLHGFPPWTLYLTLAALFLRGLNCTLSPDLEREKLKISSPHVCRDSRYQSKNQWRMKVRNKGPVTAANVEMHLIRIDPKPRYDRWTSDYPYPVILVGPPNERLFSCRIIKHKEALFEPVSGFRNECGKFFISGIDTKNRSDIPVIIGPDERWTLAYAINAENAKPIEFSLDLSIEDSAVMVKRKRVSRQVPKSRRSPQKRET